MKIHRHRYGQKWKLVSGEVRCIKCGEKMPREEVERRINATEFLSAMDAEYAVEHYEICGFWLNKALTNYAKTLGKVPKQSRDPHSPDTVGVYTKEEIENRFSIPVYTKTNGCATTPLSLKARQ